MTDWPEIHENVVRQFRIAWEKPDPHAWDGFLDDSVRFVQPMLRDGVGPALWWEEFARTQALLPDLRVEVLRWAGAEENVFVHIRFVATAGGRPLSWEAVDLLKLSPEGRLLFRESFFDSVPPAAALARRPRAWLRWWRSGIGPFLGRRRFLPPAP
ncbi:nuclear transport factor 2 family protein [Kribbella soli]|uniref:Nuclear transport factor 2 family protein n=1 Tax=Kribbella soli TaxID=1124743 RepID=A0A4R0H8F9_9ACTN|nr:nuclear transport factor 2 family protein [Kribbella soli]TCC03949.1 nuclear transport factor 2 family protein [Kribbella soli]